MLNVLVVLLASQANGVQSNDPPPDAAVLRALPKLPRGVPFVFEQFRDDMTIVKNRLAGVTVRLPLPTRSPLTLTVGHWECVAYYTETTQTNFPFPAQVKKNRVTVVYLDNLGVAK